MPKQRMVAVSGSHRRVRGPDVRPWRSRHRPTRDKKVGDRWGVLDVRRRVTQAATPQIRRTLFTLPVPVKGALRASHAITTRSNVA
jgi:hypothetical protein